jgi:hypothetical protein
VHVQEIQEEKPDKKKEDSTVANKDKPVVNSEKKDDMGVVDQATDSNPQPKEELKANPPSMPNGSGVASSPPRTEIPAPVQIPTPAQNMDDGSQMQPAH